MQSEPAKPESEGEHGEASTMDDHRKEDESGMSERKATQVKNDKQEQAMDTKEDVKETEQPLEKPEPYFIPIEEFTDESGIPEQNVEKEYLEMQAVRQEIGGTPGFWYINGPNGKVIPGLESHPPSELARNGAICPVDWLPVE